MTEAIDPITTREAIFRNYEVDAGDGRRPHLGASLIGTECERALWYAFRWAKATQFPGRILRLFETGQLEEARLVRNLRRTGATVLEVDPDTGRQFRVETHGGHFGGSMDAIAHGLLEDPGTWHVVEFKTHGVKSFGDLQVRGVKVSKPQHHAQMQTYLHLSGLQWAMYVAVCKDSDDIHVERVPADPALAQGLLDKAARVISASAPAPRLSDDPTWFQCRFCDYRDICHGQQPASVNCRTCLSATPVDGGWHCDRHDRPLPMAEQRQGCERHLYLPALVPGKQIDAGDDWVEYEFPDGQCWRDQGSDKQMEVCA
jgi:hypothetical protein